MQFEWRRRDARSSFGGERPIIRQERPDFKDNLRQRASRLSLFGQFGTSCLSLSVSLCIYNLHLEGPSHKNTKLALGAFKACLSSLLQSAHIVRTLLSFWMRAGKLVNSSVRPTRKALHRQWRTKRESRVTPTPTPPTPRNEMAVILMGPSVSQAEIVPEILPCVSSYKRRCNNNSQRYAASKSKF